MPDDTQPATPTPPLGEATAAQDPRQTFGGLVGLNAMGLGYASAAPGVNGTAGQPALPIAALLGTGSLEGTNKYDAPLMGGMCAPGILPGFGAPLPGTYATYRIMSRHPTLVLAAGAFMMQALGVAWSYKAKEGAPADAEQFIHDTIEPLRLDITMECLKATIFGHRAFEKVYEAKDGRQTLKRLKPLLPELTKLNVDAHGNFAGVMCDKVTLGPEKSWVYTYDKDCDDPYGNSRHENVRRTWSNWLNVEDNLGRLGAKTSSIIPHIGYPPGKGVDENNVERSNYKIAQTVASGLASGRPVVMPNLSTLEIDDLFRMPELAKGSLWSIDTIDMGNPGPAIQSLLEQLNYYDKLLVRGWLQPERSLLEAQKGGSRADSDSHGDVGTSDAAHVLADIVRAINCGVIDDLLAINFGEAARGTVYAEPAPMVDQFVEVDQAILAGIAGNPQLMAKLLSEMDMASYFARRGIPVREGQKVDWSNVEDEMAQQQKDMLAAKAPQPGDAEDEGDDKAKATKMLSLALADFAGDDAKGE